MFESSLRAQLKCWCARGEEDAKRAELAAMAAPPPPKAGAVLGAAEDSGPASSGAPPAYGGGGGHLQPRAGVHGRYAAATNLGISAHVASGGESFMNGERSPRLAARAGIPLSLAF